MNDEPTYHFDDLLQIIPLAEVDIIREINRKVIEERRLYDRYSLNLLVLQISKRLMELGPLSKRQEDWSNNLMPPPTYSTDFLREAIPLSNEDQLDIMGVCVIREQHLYNLLDYDEIITLFETRINTLTNGHRKG